LRDKERKQPNGEHDRHTPGKNRLAHATLVTDTSGATTDTNATGPANTTGDATSEAGEYARTDNH